MRNLMDIYKRHDDEIKDLKTKIKEAREDLTQGRQFYWNGQIDDDALIDYIDNCIARLKEIEQ